MVMISWRSILACCAAACVTLAQAADALPADARDWFFAPDAAVQDVATLHQRAEAGAVADQLAYARALYAQHDKAQAASWLLEANTQGSGVAAYLLGLLYEHGDGVAIDAAQAEYFLHKAALLRQIPAEFELGTMLLDAEFDDAADAAQAHQRHALGVALVQAAARQGWAPAQLRAGMLCRDGEIPGCDAAQAWDDFVAAAAQGSIAAAYMVGVIGADAPLDAAHRVQARQALHEVIRLAPAGSDYAREAGALLAQVGE
jgi:TPR repeat protein